MCLVFKVECVCVPVVLEVGCVSVVFELALYMSWCLFEVGELLSPCMA